MHKADTSLLPKLLLVGVASATMAIGASAAVSATTEPPTDTAAPAAAGSVAPDVAAFCDAEIALEAAASSEDPATMGPAIEALAAAAPEDVRATVEELIANAENTDSPEFAEAYSAMIEYMRANCGFAELGVAASEYAFGGIAEEIAAGPTIVNFENIGEEAHEFVLFRVNDDVTLTVEELLALPQEEVETMVTQVGGTFALPGDTGYTVLELTPGRHVAVCFVPQGTTIEVIEEMIAAEEAAAASSIPGGSAPADSAAEGTAPTGTEHAEMAPDTAPAEGSVPAEGSAPAGEEGTPHFMLGMVQEFTVV
jgi:hypothetical protein